MSAVAEEARPVNAMSPLIRRARPKQTIDAMEKVRELLETPRTSA